MAKTTRIFARILLVSICLGLLSPRLAADPIPYSLTNLSQRYPIGINNQGQVGLGYSYSTQVGWQLGLAQPQVYPPTVNIYNSFGSAAGTLSAPNSSGQPGGGNGSTISWVNDNGGSTGISYEQTSDGRIATPYVNIGGVQQSLNVWTDPGAINNAGQVVGVASFPNIGPLYHAFLYSGGQTTDLGTGGNYSLAAAINNSGVVVGWTGGPPGVGVQDSHAFVYQNGVMTDLTSALGGGLSAANGINSLGVIVGEMNPSGEMNPTLAGHWHAFMLNNGQVTDLNSLLPGGSGWTLLSATAINDLGQIIGFGTDPEGNLSTFLLTPPALGNPLAPVPEPASIICSALILAAVIVRGKIVARRRTQPSTAL